LGAAEGGALFLDRDGLLNELVFYPSSGEWESPRIRADFRLLPGVGGALAAFSEAGWPLFLVSNQPSCAKGKTTMADLLDVHAALLEALAPLGVAFREAYYCYHHPDSIVPELKGPCACRKPSPHFLREAARVHGLDLSASWMIGDQDMDLLCGRNAGCRTVLVPDPNSSSKRGSVVPDRICDDLAQVLHILD
jgi:D-glycero-D-manno-heptose 1,7-bisphosphate phosphatase